jgi:hypothetical protein
MERIGLDARLYRNSGSYSTPTWVEVKQARDVTLTLERGTAEVSKRGSKWKTYLPALKDATIEFELAYDPADANFTALRTAYLDGTVIDMAILDGVVTQGGSGFRSEFIVTSFTRNEPLEDLMTVSVTIRPTATMNEPMWI